MQVPPIYTLPSQHAFLLADLFKPGEGTNCSF